MKFLRSWLYHTARKRAGAFLWTQLCRKAPDLLRVSRFLLGKLLHK